jgi:DNA-binding transcriptional LysR family regulator
VLAMLVAVADSGSFIAGAELVHRSPSALSMQIKALEAALGKPLFIRNTRNLALTPDGHTLLGYARQMLALRDEAWAEMVRPEVRGRVRIGMPDDYASSLLPPVLRTFSATYPRVEIQVVGRPSHELALQIKDNTLDLACITRTRGCPGEFIRMEPMVWVGSAANRPIWMRPLPIAVFAEGSVARDNAIKALQGAGIPYRMSYESPSIQGLVSMVDAGLAIAPLARCGVPAHLIQLGEAEGLPRLAELEMVLARTQSSRPPCDYLAELIFQALQY